MSKDKGDKNKKKSPANKSDKVKPVSDYKLENKNGADKQSTLGVLLPKQEGKGNGGRKV